MIFTSRAQAIEYFDVLNEYDENQVRCYALHVNYHNTPLTHPRTPFTYAEGGTIIKNNIFLVFTR